MFTTFADPKTDFIFKRIFGTEANKHLLVGLLNDLLELEGRHRILDVTYLPSEQAPPLPEMKLSVVDVKCRDEQGRTYIVEMQVLNVDGFEKRTVYNASKAYVMQLPSGETYRDLAPVVGVTICDFVFWSPNGDGSTAGVVTGGMPVPMLSRWRMQEQRSGVRSFSDVQYSFLELPKYAAGAQPVSRIERWAYFFREAENLTEVPPALRDPPFRGALEVARTANFTAAEWEAYDRAKMAEQDARGALSFAHREGLVEGLRRTVEDLCEVLGIEWTVERRTRVEAMSLSDLETLREHLKTHKLWP
jgi:predicted transposase/invertase (TIGR01784 family)